MSLHHNLNKKYFGCSLGSGEVNDQLSLILMGMGFHPWSVANESCVHNAA